MQYILILILIWAATGVMAADRISGRSFATRSEVLARHGMAATSQPLATQAAVAILQKGGNAVDAAIAANAVQCVVEPMSCGLGGDLFALIWSAEERKLHGLNGSGRSPQGLTSKVFQEKGLNKIPLRGPLTVSVPGCVDAWFVLHERFGKLPMRLILEPAIAYAREGFPVSQIIADYWRSAQSAVKDQPNFKATFLPGGRAPKAGEVFKNPGLADVLALLAKEGRAAFYRGRIARIIDRFCRQEGCYLRYQDLADHRSNWVAPVSTAFCGHTIWELPPNGQGIAVLQMLNILEGFDLKQMGHNSADYIHHLVEAKKLAFEDRAKFYADPSFHAIPVSDLISKSYGKRRRALMQPDRAAQSLPAGDPQLQRGDTVYLTCADEQGNMVSLIQSTYYGFGSGLVPDGLGFALQNRGALFSLAAGHWNQYAPGKRPFHTIIPAFITKDGEPYVSFGVMGGDMQPQGHVQIILNLLVFGMNLQEAGDAPRVRHLGSSSPRGDAMTDGGYVVLESQIPDAVREALRAKGHRLAGAKGGFGGYQAILYGKANKVYHGASESRKDGCAAGY